MSLSDWLNSHEENVISKRKKHLEEMCLKFNLSRKTSKEKNRTEGNLIILENILNESSINDVTQFLTILTPSPIVTLFSIKASVL
jgi:hypothetical protein